VLPNRRSRIQALAAKSLKYLEEEKKMSIWTILFIILLIAWITGFSVFHVAGGLIHLLLVFAVISLILHFVMGRSAV
jgi:hypothetical protein